jgi:hypothetical protein
MSVPGVDPQQLIRRIGRALLGAAPPGWRQIRAEYRAAGRHIEADVLVTAQEGEPHPIRPPMDVVELLGELRAVMYRPGRGTWMSGLYVLDHPSKYNAEFEPDTEPRWRRPPPPIGFQDELRRFPREDVHIPEWLRLRAGLPPTADPTPTPPSGIPAPAAGRPDQPAAPAPADGQSRPSGQFPVQSGAPSTPPGGFTAPPRPATPPGEFTEPQPASAGGLPAPRHSAPSTPPGGFSAPPAGTSSAGEFADGQTSPGQPSPPQPGPATPPRGDLAAPSPRTFTPPPRPGMSSPAPGDFAPRPLGTPGGFAAPPSGAPAPHGVANTPSGGPPADSPSGGFPVRQPPGGEPRSGQVPPAPPQS